MKRLMRTLVFAGAAAIVLAPMQARADGWIAPWIGQSFVTNFDNGRGTFGVSAGGMGGGIVGGEVDFGYNPSFFGTQNEFGNNSVLNVMANVIVGVPIGGTYGKGVRPYVVGGVGLIRTQIDGASNTTFFTPASSANMFGWDAGAGVMGFFNDHVGLRGEIRYLRATQDWNESNRIPGLRGDRLHFWRPSIGVVFR
jgi:opacity protein-like surface antigen